MLDSQAIERYQRWITSEIEPERLETREVRAGLGRRALVVVPVSEELVFTEEVTIAVAGAGPSGLLIAQLLAMRGHQVCVLERASSLNCGATWNISREELEDLRRTNAFTPHDLEELILGNFNEGLFRLYDAQANPPAQRDFNFNAIYNISIDEKRFLETLGSSPHIDVRLEHCVKLLRLTTSGVYLKVKNHQNERIIRAKLFIDARGWTSPLAQLIQPHREIESIYNIIGVRTTQKLDRELDATGCPKGYSACTFTDEMKTSSGLVQPCLERFTDYLQSKKLDAGDLLHCFTRTDKPAHIGQMFIELEHTFAQMAPGFNRSMIGRTYYGHIPGYLPPRPWSGHYPQACAGDRLLLIGCAAQQYSSLTGAAFGALVRNASSIADAIHRALNDQNLSFSRLKNIDIDRRERLSQAVESLFGPILLLSGNEPSGTVNREFIALARLSDKIDGTLKNEAFRDKLRLKTINQLLKAAIVDIQVLRALVRNNRGRNGLVLWVVVTAYLGLLKLEIEQFLKRRRKLHLFGAIDAVFGFPVFLSRAIRLWVRANSLTKGKKPEQKDKEDVRDIL